ncbi:signal-transducing histidine kinase-like protein [Haloferax elongans ATCC BAA-1513]|uniref:histidine kinase n=1 Tax=Haloferax elongans ATCC BAA-1513 TaxID=1230453 RepID=M0HUA6_HALEO|nr:GAF domain-containing protein [Haloferax elongans]ELZ87333.1 signal-transducing histidine kinase-like protein [Haloferax elongans ATCC BAA-1513]
MEPTILVEEDVDCDLELGGGVTVASSSDTSESSEPVCAIVSDPDESVARDVPTILYTDIPPEDISNPGRFAAYVRCGDGESLQTQIRWVLSQSQQSRTNAPEQSQSGTPGQSQSNAPESNKPQPNGEWDRIRQLYEGTTTLIAADSVEELYQRALGLAGHILDFDNSSFLVHEGDGMYLRASDRYDVEEAGPIPADKGILGQTYQARESFLIDDVRTHPEAAPADPAYRSVVSVPMGDIGVFQAISNEVGAYDETDRRLAELLARYVSETRARIISEAEMAERREQIERLHHGATELATATTLEDLFERTVEISDDILEFDISYVGRVEDDSIIPTAISSGMPADGAERVSLEDGGLAALAYTTGETHIADDVRDHPEARPAKRMYRAVLSVPIGDFGVFQAASFEADAFGDADVELTELLMAHVTVAAEHIDAETHLREERDRSSALFDHVSDAAVAYDVENETVSVRCVNHAFQETFGYDAADVVGTDLLGRVIPCEDEDERNECEHGDCIPELLVAAGESYRGEVRRRTEDGIREFILNVVPLSPGEERGSGYAIYTDITERKKRESELERQNERLEEFANIVSHDLRNPLSVARGNLELAKETGEEDRFDTALGALDQMEELIDDLLSLARRGQLVDETAPVEVASAARAAWSRTETHDAQLTVSEGVKVEADKDRLVELLSNLFRNAVEHGREDISVTVGGLDGGFFVEDDGPGIEPERRDEVFEPGETTGGDGIGYGLAIVSSIAEAHGWSVIVTSGRAGGARFEFRA